MPSAMGIGVWTRGYLHSRKDMAVLSSLAATLQLLGCYSVFLLPDCREPSIVAEVTVDFRVFGDDSTGRGIGMRPFKLGYPRTCQDGRLFGPIYQSCVASSVMGADFYDAGPPGPFSMSSLQVGYYGLACWCVRRAPSWYSVV